MRLTFITQGRVQVCYRETFSSICDTDFDTHDASVICRQLGFSSRGKGFQFAWLAEMLEQVKSKQKVRVAVDHYDISPTNRQGTS